MEVFPNLRDRLPDGLQHLPDSIDLNMSTAIPNKPRIAVLGSINIDLVVRCAGLPVPGQTIIGQSLSEFSGGKGANQAVAAALSGGQVSMIGAVGDDGFSDRLIRGLENADVDCQQVQRLAGSSGTALITVDDAGENSIIVIPGANGQLSRENVRRAQTLIATSDLLMVQLEVPVDVVLSAMEIARQNEVKIMLDPAPAVARFPVDLLKVDLICPNETEAATLTGLSVTCLADAAKAAERLHQLGARQVAITLGGEGTWLSTGQAAQHIPAFSVTPVDTTAAGDAFAGALAVRWLQTGDLAVAVEFANAAGGLAASRPGAQASMANQQEIEKLWSTKK
jgi:ribokinase